MSRSGWKHTEVRLKETQPTTRAHTAKGTGRSVIRGGKRVSREEAVYVLASDRGGFVTQGNRLRERGTRSKSSVRERKGREGRTT